MMMIYDDIFYKFFLSKFIYYYINIKRIGEIAAES